ncbi:DUF4837 family protein [Maribacter arcticus]|uniref:DH domain-containing protein n=1 Tax=Maribacter arcticus TaxID=561365 RepID=A0A1T5BTV0_9FLAO|nr:DUF4837 family protein [Maribacter arcticus]SKB50738.1 protein of unknown function [Maribacter arcticus]|tara:strand:- start:2969 stop:3970 length:1002 start_codon:yes stop_codon:yes gene_type:complete
MKKRILLCFMAILGLSIACKEEGKADYLPESVGAMNTLTVVIDNELWKSSVGDAIRENYTAAAQGLTWDEALFSVTQVPQQIFSGSIRNTSSVLYVMEDSLNVAHMKSNMYSKPQNIGVIKGRNKQELIDNINKTSAEFIKDFKTLEISKAQKRFEKSLNKEKALVDKFKISMKIPSIYRVGREEDNFVWISREIQKGNMNIIAYTMPENGFHNDSTFARDIIRMRDSIGNLYIKGSDVAGKNNHMITEKAFTPYVFPAEVSGKKAAEVRGIWEMSAYPMAGPFLTYIINDKENNRKLILEGFVFAPATKKRDYMFELEAILKSVQFNVEEKK